MLPGARYRSDRSCRDTLSEITELLLTLNFTGTIPGTIWHEEPLSVPLRPCSEAIPIHIAPIYRWQVLIAAVVPSIRARPGVHRYVGRAPVRNNPSGGRFDYSLFLRNPLCAGPIIRKPSSIL